MEIDNTGDGGHLSSAYFYLLKYVAVFDSIDLLDVIDDSLILHVPERGVTAAMQLVTSDKLPTQMYALVLTTVLAAVSALRRLF